MFEKRWQTLKHKPTAYLKTWFAKVRLGRELYNDKKLIQDEFSQDGPLRKWAGLANNNINEAELIKAIKRELRLGVRKLEKKKFQPLLEVKDIYTDIYSIEEQKKWFKTIRHAREKSNDNKTPIDIFSVKGKLRDWIGLSN